MPWGKKKYLLSDKRVWKTFLEIPFISGCWWAERRGEERRIRNYFVPCTQKNRFSCFFVVSLTGRTLLPADIVAVYYLYFSDCFLWEAYKIIFIYLYCDLVTWNQMNIAVASLNLCWKQHRACAESLTQTSSSSPFPCVERETSSVNKLSQEPESLCSQLGIVH